MKRYADKVDFWQLWNEPNLGLLKGDVDVYAKLVAAAGQAIHEANPKAKVLTMNMAFCDVLWASNVMQRVPYTRSTSCAFIPTAIRTRPRTSSTGGRPTDT